MLPLKWQCFLTSPIAWLPRVVVVALLRVVRACWLVGCCCLPCVWCRCCVVCVWLLRCVSLGARRRRGIVGSDASAEGTEEGAD